jgi:hypothetical protein
MDNYQQDSTLDYKDKRVKSNQKTVSTSAFLGMDSNNNPLFFKNALFYEQLFGMQILGKIYISYIRRPLVSGCYINKYRKKYFSGNVLDQMNNLIRIRKSFSISKIPLKNYLNRTIILKKYFELWKIYTEKTSEPYTYNRTITRISSKNEKENGEFFSYYCKINKSNQENDFVFLRISLGYKLLRKVFCGNNHKKFLYLLKRRRRRKNRAKTFVYKGYSKNIFNLLDFKIKLPIILNKIIMKKYYSQFYHKLLYYSLYLNNNIEYNLNQNNVCQLIREGYKKGYFKILYNILNERFSFQYYSTGLKFESFVKSILTLRR